MLSKMILMTAFAAALSTGVPGMAQAPAADAEQAKSSAKKKAVEAPPHRRRRKSPTPRPRAWSG